MGKGVSQRAEVSLMRSLIPTVRALPEGPMSSHHHCGSQGFNTWVLEGQSLRPQHMLVLTGRKVATFSNTVNFTAKNITRDRQVIS